ncbi:TylF/MycF/NovP-related O-methyltransferase [Actinomadura fulvescens]|uniref:Uncharacterized protein n=1 Tax=Actinomadura fulvescens TaxID=46160 RepID=A0ABP6D831_9ACTN
MPEGRRKYDAAFREGAVRIVRSTDKPVALVARVLGIVARTLHHRVKADRVEAAGLKVDERAELARLRAENAELRRERDVLKRSVVAPPRGSGWFRLGRRHVNVNHQLVNCMRHIRSETGLGTDEMGRRAGVPRRVLRRFDKGECRLAERRFLDRLAATFGFDASAVLGRPVWERDGGFMAAYERVVAHTLISIDRCFHLFQYAQSVRDLPGAAAEVGVFRGGSAKLIAEAVGARKLYLFDTFTGIPAHSPTDDLHQTNDFAETELAVVERLFEGQKNVVLVPGVFPESATEMQEAFCFVHVDTDVYGSALDCCRYFYPRLVSGGVMVFDDYGSYSCPGIKRAVDEYFADKGEWAIQTTGHQAVIRKVAYTGNGRRWSPESMGIGASPW